MAIQRSLVVATRRRQAFPPIDLTDRPAVQSGARA